MSRSGMNATLVALALTCRAWGCWLGRCCGNAFEAWAPAGTGVSRSIRSIWLLAMSCFCSTTPTVTTIHDLSVLVHPEWHPEDRVRWYEHAFEAGLQQTQRFIAASEFTKREMVERCGISPDVIDVTYQAARPVFGPKAPGQVRSVLAALGLPDCFFLYVGTLEPRKNVTGLLDAYAALPVGLRRRHPLVVAGAWGWKQEALREKLAQRDLSSDVRLVGYVTDEHLACLYSACTALVWPTWYEGFGMPPLEAMACKAPVIVSDVSSLPEVVGQAGVLLDPQDLTAWTDAMRQMAQDATWRETRRQRGGEQAARFSWSRCLVQTVSTYRSALERF